MSYKNLKKPNFRFIPLLALAFSLGLAGCGSGGKKGEGLLGEPVPEPPKTSSSSSGATSSSSSSSSSGLAAGTAIDPTTNAILNVKLTAEAGEISYGETRKIQLTFTDAKGAAFDPTFSVAVTSNCLTVSKKSSISDPIISSNSISFVYTTLGCLGDDLVTFTANGSAGKTSELGKVKLVTKGETVAFITEVGKPVPNKIYLGGEGTPKASDLTFKVVGQSGQPLSGQVVVFSNAGVQGGINISPTSATSNKDGIVTTRVTAGTVPTIASVKAVHEGSKVEGTSSSLDVSSSLPSDGKFTLAVRAYNLRAYAISQEESTTITATLLDSAGNKVPDGTLVKFTSNEQGKVDGSCATVNGDCSVKFSPNGVQPADGRVQVFAYTLGSERFQDNNSNKVFDDGDIFNASMDLGEPFSDDNDNGVHDLGEFFIDANTNGKRDGPDGKWNGVNCKYEQYCAENKSQLVALSQQVTLYLSTGNVYPCELGKFGEVLWVRPGGTLPLSGLYLSDGNQNAVNEAGHGCLKGNPLPNGSKISFTAAGGSIINPLDETIENNQVFPSGPYSVTFKASEKAGIEYINLKTTMPARGGLAEKVVTLTWPVIVSETKPDDITTPPPVTGNTGTFLDPSLNQKLIATADVGQGNFLFGVAKPVKLIFTNEAGMAQATTSQISVTSACITSGRATVSQPTTSDNTVTLTYTAQGCIGDDVLNFSAAAGGTTVAVKSLKIVTEGETVAGLLFVSAVPNQLPIATDGPDSGKLSTLTFKVVGPSGNGVSGEKVTFALDGIAGGVALVNLVDESDSQGLVTALVRAGTAPNNVTVIATHVDSGATKRSEGLTVASGLALEGNFTMGISVFNPNAYNFLALAGQELVNISVGVRDASGNAVLDGTVVNFTSPEAGIVTSSCFTVKGGCSVGWRPTKSQPLDGRVRIAAIVKASEHFEDRNGNLLFDEGDVFDVEKDDLGEPFIDLNEDGKYQINEPFTDSNLNKIRDEGDGKWNGLNCQYLPLCGEAKSVDLQVSGVIHLSNYQDPITLARGPQLCNLGNFGDGSTPIDVVAGRTLSLSGLMFSDGNPYALNPGYACLTGNSLPAGTKIQAKVSNGTILAGESYGVLASEKLPNGPFGLLYKAPNELGGQALTISIEIPPRVTGEEGVKYTYFWSINVIAPPTP